MSADHHRPGPDWPLWLGCGILAGGYALLIVGMLLADTAMISVGDVLTALRSREIRFATLLSLLTCGITAILAVVVAVPTGYLLARGRFRGKGLLDAIFDIPIVLPPLVIGLSLLVLFQVRLPLIGRLNDALPITYTVLAVIVAQFVVGAAFAVRTMRSTFEHLSERPEQVALTLGASRWQAFSQIALPMSWRGALTAGTLAWARSMGEFGPILVFAGATRLKTEVLPTTVFLELSVGNLEAATVVSLLMVALSLIVLLLVRLAGERRAA
jgi:molybdate transport system permease protein